MTKPSYKKQVEIVMKKPTFNNTRIRQLHRLAEEGRPAACNGCGFENACATRGCAVLRSISHIVATIERRDPRDSQSTH